MMQHPSRDRSALSGPPLSVGRLRQNSARDPHMHWRGIGLTACIGTFELGDPSVEGSAAGRVVLPRLLREMPAGGDSWLARSTRSARSRRTLAGFFEAGGREIVVLDDARCAATGRWIGEDGGPGKRTGIFQLLDMQDVSTVVVLGGDAPARERVLGVARRRPDKLFLFTALSPRSGVDRDPDPSRRGPQRECVSFLLPNAAEAGPFPDGVARDEGGDRRAASPARRDADALREVDGLMDLGRLVAMLECTDFVDEPRSGARPDARRWPERTPGLVRLMAWRRWEGLRRSIELGSRWTVMDLHHPLVWRHVERDIRGFLHRMSDYGLVQRPGASGFQVRCAPRPVDASRRRGAAVPAVDIHVAVRLKPPYDVALSPVTRPVSETLHETPRPFMGDREGAEVKGTDPSSSRGEEQP